jgi:hypothetical protein
MTTTFVWTKTFRDGMAEFMRETGQTIEPAVRDLFGLLVKKAYDWTPPKKRSSGTGKVASDVGRVIKSTESDKLLNMLYRRFGAVHITDQEMTGIGGKKWRIINTTIDPSGSRIEQVHASRRAANGTVPKGRGHVVLTTNDNRVAYTKRVQKRVGKLKAGWSGPMKELGRKVPAWVDAAGSSSGRSGKVGGSPIVSTINPAKWSGSMHADNATPYANDATKKIAAAHKHIEKHIAGKHFQRWLEQAIERHKPKGTP